MDAMVQLLEVMAKLRDPKGGCPWDREQTYSSIVPHTIEEAYEVAEAAERGLSRELKDELGDLLFQVVFLARIAEETGEFDFFAVCTALVDKLIRRHPHVFGESAMADSASVIRQWEEIKASEREKWLGASPFDGIPRALPSLSRAAKVQRRVARLGFDWPDIIQVLAKVEEEFNELQCAINQDPPIPEDIEEELGDLLFSCVNVARHLGLDAEAALRKTVRRFEARIDVALSLIAETGQKPTDLSSTELDSYWMMAKSRCNDVDRP